MGFFEKLAFTYVNPIVAKGRKGEIANEDLTLPVEQQADASYKAFQVGIRGYKKDCTCAAHQAPGVSSPSGPGLRAENPSNGDGLRAR